jgi:hypothetical protein
MSSLIQASRNMLHLSLTRRGGLASTFVRSLYKQYSLIQMYFFKRLLFGILIILSIKANKNFRFFISLLFLNFDVSFFS